MTREGPSIPDEKKQARKRRGKFRRARVRNFLFTIGPDRLTGGRIKRRHSQRDVEVREVELASPGWPSGFDGLRIGHVSDFHLGELLSVEKAVRIVDLLAEQEPDLVACTGDVVDLHHAGVEPLLQALASTGAPMGSLLVLGNHDELECGRAVAKLARDAGLIVLEDEAIAIQRNGASLQVAGTRWGRTTSICSQQVNAAAGDGTHLLLSHNPKSFRRAAQLGIPLTLAGHTHGGQMAVKNRPNTNLAVTERLSAGPFTRHESNLFVTTGVGTWFPVRINCPAEVAMITMRHGSVDEARDYNPFVQRLRDRIAERKAKSIDSPAAASS